MYKICSSHFRPAGWPVGQPTATDSGVFSTGATGAIAPAILRKRVIAPAIFLTIFGYLETQTKVLPGYVS